MAEAHFISSKDLLFHSFDENKTLVLIIQLL